MTIYFASKTRHAPRWRELRDRGVPIVSSWIDEASHGQTSSLEELADRCLVEAAHADCLILYSEVGEEQQGALVECGAALANGKPVISVCDPAKPVPASVFKEHHRWFEAGSIDTALALANQIGQSSPSSGRFLVV